MKLDHHVKNAVYVLLYIGLSQIMDQTIISLIGILIYCKFLKNQIETIDFKKVLKALISGFACASLTLVLTYLLSDYVVSANQLLINQRIIKYPVYAFFTIVIIAPVVEELVFRGIVQKWVQITMSKFASILLVSLIFAWLHIRTTDQIVFLPIYMITSLVSGYMYEKHNNITYSIVIHFVVNFVGFWFYFFIH